MSTMRAAVIRKYGGPEVFKIENVPKPTPKKNQVLVNVYATSVTTADWRVSGPNPPPAFGFSFLFRLIFGISAPRKKVLGQEFAGVVEEVGSNVTEFKVGDEVFGTNDINFGAHAEYVCVDSDYAITHKPPEAAMANYGAIAFGGVTALYFLRDEGKLKIGDKLLIVGASGCLGTFAVQLGKYFGADVTGVCSTKNVDLVKELGADQVIDYTIEDYKSSAVKYDYIFDTVGKISFPAAKKILKDDGQLLAAAFNGWGDIRKVIFNSMFGGKKKYKLGTPTIGNGTKKDLKFLSDLIQNGKLKVVLDSNQPLEQISDAFQLVNTGHKRGCAGIVIKES